VPDPTGDAILGRHRQFVGLLLESFDAVDDDHGFVSIDLDDPLGTYGSPDEE
jgi:hypothetical protein